MALKKLTSFLACLALGFALGTTEKALAQSTSGNPDSILPGTLLIIDSIRVVDGYAVITAQVSADIRTVTLEARPRLGSGNWEPKAVQRLDESQTTKRKNHFCLIAFTAWI